MVFSEEDKAQLLLPVAEDAFCGSYLKGDKSAFRPLRNSFNIAQTSLRKLTQNPDINEVDDLTAENIQNWQAICEQLLQVFSSSSRDIELIGWFLAGQLQLDPSMQSFTKTLEWLSVLVEEHWDDLHPVLPSDKLKSEDEKGQLAEQAEAKTKAFFQWLGDSEESTLLFAPIVNLHIMDEVTFFQYQSADRKGQLNTLKTEISTSISVQRAEIQQKLQDCHYAIELLNKISASATAKTKLALVAAPNFSFVKSLLTKFENAIQHLTGLKPLIEQVPVAEVSENLESEQNTGIQGEVIPSKAEQGPRNMLVISANNLTETARNNGVNRDIAFNQLRELSDYFRQTEPHSPVPFLLDKAIRWGSTPFPVLLREMMAEADTHLIDKILENLDQFQSDHAN